MLNKIRYKIVFNRSGRLNQRGEGLLQIECLQDNRRIYFSTHTYVRPENYSCGRIIGLDNADSLNYALFMMIRDIENIELEYIKKGVDVNLPMLKDAVKTNVNPSAKLRDFGLSVIESSERKELTKANYLTLFNNIDKFKKNVYLTDVNYQFVVDYDKFLRESCVSHNTRVSRLRLLRALVNEAKKRDFVGTNPFDRFRIQQMVSKKGYITFQQLKKLEDMVLTGKTDIARDAFLVGCYTGLRFSDIKTLRNEHFKDGWIVKKMLKTNMVVEIPTNIFGSKIKSIVEKYSGDIGNLTKQISSDSTINQLLKPLFEKIGADAKITFHSSRHTCATLLGQKGVDLSIIQKILGHSKIQTTEIYREVDKSTILNGLKKAIK